MSTDLPRRTVVAALAVSVLPAAAQPASPTLEAALRDWAAGAPLRTGKVKLDIAPLIDNGNTVPVTITVDHPMTETDFVREIALFNEKNPQRDMIRARLTPRAGVARLSTRVRLATSQPLVAVARLADGSCWQQRVDVIVTLAACIE